MSRGAQVGVLIVLVLLAGCNQKTSISGNVTYNGNPIENGYVSFNPKAHGRTIAGQITNGKYSIEEATPGQFTVLVTGTKKLNHAASSADAYATAAKTGAHVLEAADYIAPEAEGNGQEVQIAAGAQTMDFAVTGPPIPK
ncbi:MAG: hypothetical protein U0805_03360 [Pirellulales bacterium]